MKLSLVEKKALTAAIAERQRAEAECSAIFRAVFEAHGLDPDKSYRIEHDEILLEDGSDGGQDVDAEAAG